MIVKHEDENKWALIEGAEGPYSWCMREMWEKVWFLGTGA
jgi:hypothetical protein